MKPSKAYMEMLNEEDMYLMERADKLMKEFEKEFPSTELIIQTTPKKDTTSPWIQEMMDDENPDP